jgi:hypothetical protein
MAYPRDALETVAGLAAGSLRVDQTAVRQGLAWPREPPGIIGQWCEHSAIIPRHEFMEATELAVFRFVLVQKLQVGLVEFLEKFVPADFFQTLFLRAEIDAENAGVPALSRLFHGRGRPVALLYPFLDLLTVRGGVTFTHVEQL